MPSCADTGSEHEVFKIDIAEAVVGDFFYELGAGRVFLCCLRELAHLNVAYITVERELSP